MWSKILYISGWTIGLLALFVLLVAAVSASQQTIFKEILVKIDHGNENYFIDESEVKETVSDLGYENGLTALREVDPRKIEHILENNAFIEDAQVYKQLNGILHVDVKVRQPILRIFNTKGKSIYIDQDGVFMPLSYKYYARTPIANGNISIDLNQIVGLSVNDLNNQIDHPETKILADLFTVASTCAHSKFWKAQFNQFYVNSAKEIELIPRVGDHQVLIGSTQDLDKKLYKLKLFYDEGLSKTGWNEYKIINLKYANQVVCTKS